MSDEIAELRAFIRHASEVAKDLAIQLAPVFHRMAELRDEIADTMERKDGHIIGFRGPRQTVPSIRICAVRQLDNGDRAFDYAELPVTVILRHASDIEARKPLFAELDRLAVVYGPDRNRLRDLNVEIKSATAALARLAKPKTTRKERKPLEVNRQGQLL